MSKTTFNDTDTNLDLILAKPTSKLEPEWDDCTEEEGMAEYEEFMLCLEEDEVLGPSWRHAQGSRGWR